MTNFGGPVMTGTTNVYNIWYGDWSSDPGAITTMAGLFQNLNGTPYLNLAGQFYGASTHLDFKGSTIVSDYLGDNLSDQDLARIVKDFVNPANPNGGAAESNAIYFIFTGYNVHEQSENDACGFHTDTGGLKYAWIGGGAASQIGCGKYSNTENLTMNATGQLFDTLTDPLIGEATSLASPLGWYDAGPNQTGGVADACAGNGDTIVPANETSYLVQQIYVAAAQGKCISSFAYPGHPAGTLPDGSQPNSSATPEPSPWALMVIGIGGMGAALRARRRKCAA